MNDEGFHGDLTGPPSGPVDILIPDWATPEEVGQFERWVETANLLLARQRAEG